MRIIPFRCDVIVYVSRNVNNTQDDCPVSTYRSIAGTLIAAVPIVAEATSTIACITVVFTASRAGICRPGCQRCHVVPPVAKLLAGWGAMK
jgi:hypothetical protein